VKTRTTDPQSPVTMADGRDRLLTQAEVAERLGVTERWVARAIAQGTIKKTKLQRLVRIHPDDLAAFLAAAREQGEG